VHFSRFLRCKLFCGSQAALCANGFDTFHLPAALSFIRLVTLLGAPLCQFAISAHQKLRKVLVWSIDHCCLRWLCCLVRCWMLQDMDNMEANCVFYVKVSMFTHLEQSKTSHVTVNRFGIVRLTVHHHLIVTLGFLYLPGDSLRQTPAEVLSREPCLMYSWQSCDVGCRTLWFIPVHKPTTKDLHIAHHGSVGNLCNLTIYAAEFILSIINILATNYSILTWRYLYNPPEFPHLFIIIHISRLWIHNHLAQGQTHPNPADWQALCQMLNLLGCSNNTDCS
jgi:hypothetical protein